MFTYEERTSIRLFKSFKEAQPHLDTLISILADFEVTINYMEDLPICVKSRFYYPIEKKEGKTMTLNDWKDVLLLQEVKALEDFGYTVERYGDREISRDEVFETIVKWNGGISTAYKIKRIISRVYGIEL